MRRSGGGRRIGGCWVVGALNTPTTSPFDACAHDANITVASGHGEPNVSPATSTPPEVDTGERRQSGGELRQTSSRRRSRTNRAG